MRARVVGADRELCQSCQSCCAPAAFRLPFMGRGPVSSRRGPAGARRARFSYIVLYVQRSTRASSARTAQNTDSDRRWLNCGLRAQLMPGGGGCGGSLEWLLDEPGLEAPDCGFFICMKKATIIMNLRRRRRKGRRRAANSNGPAAAAEGGRQAAGVGRRRRSRRRARGGGRRGRRRTSSS